MSHPSRRREFAVDVVRRLKESGHQALFAGGCVRDALLGRPVNDFDVATTALPDEVRKLFGHRRTLAVGASFGVIVVVGPQDAGHVEVATFRTDGNYLDGRRPENVRFCSPEEDAARRDFTINGMFFDPLEERVLDFVGGESDLHHKLVRAIGDPHQRIAEDKLRMLRAVRFTATLNFSLDPITADAIRAMASELIIVSAERISQEFKKMLVDSHRRRAIEITADLELLRIVLPELDWLQRQSEWNDTLRRLEFLEQPSFELALAALLMPLSAKSVVSEICRRFKLSNLETDRIVWLVEHQHDLDQPSQLSLARLKRCLANPFGDDLLRLMTADRKATSSSLDAVEFCHDFIDRTPPDDIDPPSLITGADLIESGLQPGPRFKSMLETIRDAQLNLEIRSREEGLEMIRKLKG